MTKETKDYVVRILKAKVETHERCIAERQKWLDYHRKNPDWYEKNHDMPLTEYEAWAKKIINNHKESITKCEKAIMEVMEA